VIRFLKTSVGVALVCALSSCWAADHFHGDPTQYDNLFFGPDESAPKNAAVRTDKWRNYAVFGLVAWDEAQTRFAGTRFGAVPPVSRPMTIYVRSEESFLNILASFGVSLIGGPLGPLLFVPRTTEVIGWDG
jgi:hypothetical protein